MSDGEQTTREIRSASPALAAALSELGRQAAFPPDIPAQAAEARGTTYNATIGQITDGLGNVIELPTLTTALALLRREDRNRALLYSPVEGIPELRKRWRIWQRRRLDEPRPSTLPLVTAGLTHGLSLMADLFAGPGRAVAVPAPYWGNYRQTFALRTGARMLSAPACRDGSYNPEAIAEALADEDEGEPALAILNLPSNPGGYSPTVEERRRLLDSLRSEAGRRPLVVVCDDAYNGLVYEPGVSPESIFWELQGLHENLVPVKVDGGTKEFSYFGGRVGFLTFPFEPDSAAAAALESKVKCLVRAAIGSPVATGQMVLLNALRERDVEMEVEALRQLLENRYRVLTLSLSGLDEELLRPQPFNSGCFALVEIPESSGLGASGVRRHLLDHHDTGLVSIGERYLRIAFCSVRAGDLAEVVERLEEAVAELARRPAGREMEPTDS